MTELYKQLSAVPEPGTDGYDTPVFLILTLFVLVSSLSHMVFSLEVKIQLA